jgi:hypothetical protein
LYLPCKILKTFSGFFQIYVIDKTQKKQLILGAQKGIKINFFSNLSISILVIAVTVAAVANSTLLIAMPNALLLLSLRLNCWQKSMM